MKQKTTETAEAQQGDLDDLPGTYTIDDGHAGSYDHEATVSVGDDAVVTVTCSCGDWAQTGAPRFGDEGDTAVLAAWEAHVYKATGRGKVETAKTLHAPLVTLVYNVDHEVPDLLAIAESLRARSIVMLPSVGTSYAFADASAWESPLEQIAIRTRKTGDYRPRTIMLPGEYASLAEYTDALIRAVLDEPEQCMADGCTKSEDDSSSGYCGAECFAASGDDSDGDEVAEAFLQNVRTTWTVHLTNGMLTGYPTPQRAVFVARQFNRPMIVRISGPEGTVPLVGVSLDRALEGGVR
jgi:hypothetical protein